jgi:hypothetical protein
MTNKITLSREQVEKCLRDASIIRFSTDSHVEALRAALAEPVPPTDKGQSEHVAWQRKSKSEEGRWFYLPDDDVEEAIRLGYEVRKLYAEQPAPVAFPGYPPVPEDRKLPSQAPVPTLPQAS